MTVGVINNVSRTRWVQKEVVMKPTRESLRPLSEGKEGAPFVAPTRPRGGAVEVVCFPAHEAMRSTVVERIGKMVRRVKEHVVWARIKLLEVRDETGTQLQRCVVQLRLRALPQVVFAVTHPNAREAVAMAAERLERVLVRRLNSASIG